MILYLASDLLWATRIKSCAEDLAPPIPARPVRNLEMLAARLADSPVKGVLLDLAAGEPGHEGETAFAMLAQVQQWQSGRGPGASPVRVIAFGPHVQAADLARAKRDGADIVMARGALAANLPRVLRELEGDGGGLEDQLTD